MNLEMSTQKVSTLEAELDRTKATLREMREEMQKAARVSVDAVSKTEHRKLLDEVRNTPTLFITPGMIVRCPRLMLAVLYLVT